MFLRFLRIASLLLAGFTSVALTETSQASEAFWVEGDSTPAPGRPDSFAELATQVSPAVVFIEVTKRRESLQSSIDEMREKLEPFQEEGSPFFSPPDRALEVPETASGSGFVLSSDGYIATNNHVVEDTDTIKVKFLDGLELAAEIVGQDSVSDLALIKVESPRPLPTAPLGDSDRVRVGDWVLAIGNPFGFEHSVTAGILSARGRSLDMSSYDDFLQTDANINPGNSGGPLVDTAGRVVGIISAIRTTMSGGTTGIGFAIPINLAKALLPQLRESGGATRGWLGVQIQEVTAPMARVFGLDGPRGALIGMVLPESPVVGQLEPGDIIVRFGRFEITRMADLPRAVGSEAPGTEVEIEIFRRGRTQQLTATLGSLAGDSTPAEQIELGSNDDDTEQSDEPAGIESWGFDVEEVQPSLRQRLGLGSQGRGLRVTRVIRNGPAERQGLRPDDIILEANQRGVGSVAELTDSLSDELLVLLVRREDRTLLLTLARSGTR